MRNMEEREYTFYEDPGHGWLAVPLTDLILLGLQCAVSEYSYYDESTDYVYLEEDCDAPRFVRAYKYDFGREPKCLYFREIDRDSWIRRLPRYVAGKSGVPESHV